MSEPTASGATCARDAELAVLLALCGRRGTGVRTVHRLLASLDRCGVSPAEAAGASASAVFKRHPGLHPRWMTLLAACDTGAVDQAAKTLAAIRKRGIQPIGCRDAGYPEAFRVFLGQAAPPLVYVSGDPALFANPGAAVVGTRTPSDAGLTAAQRCARRFAERGWVLVSGGAAGVDQAAHQEALQAGGSTIVMLPQGALTYSLPPVWRHALQEGRLAMLSEVLPDAVWQVYAAVSRNALISAQSCCLCVIEPRRQGGSMRTAQHGMEQGKPVFMASSRGLPREWETRMQPIEALDGALASSDGWREAQRIQAGRPQQDTLWEGAPPYGGE